MEHRTRWAIEESRGNLARLRDWETTPFQYSCSKCGTWLETKADFEKHFLVPNEMDPYSGYCPVGRS